MPTYTFMDINNKKIYEYVLKISEKDLFIKDHPHLEQQLDATPIVAGIAGVTHTLRGDGGWQETMSKIGDANPTSPLGKQRSGKSAKEVATEKAVDKWRRKYNSGV